MSVNPMGQVFVVFLCLPDIEFSCPSELVTPLLRSSIRDLHRWSSLGHFPDLPTRLLLCATQGAWPQLPTEAHLSERNSSLTDAYGKTSPGISYLRWRRLCRKPGLQSQLSQSTGKRETSVELSRIKSCCLEPLSCECTLTLQGKEG